MEPLVYTDTLNLIFHSSWFRQQTAKPINLCHHEIFLHKNRITACTLHLAGLFTAKFHDLGQNKQGAAIPSHRLAVPKRNLLSGCAYS